MNALVIEDDKNIGHLIADSYFQRRGDVCELVHTLAAALACKNKSYDIIILDLNVPDSQGWETLVSVRAVFPVVRLMVLTGTSLRAGDIGKAHNLGADYVLQKAYVNYKSFDEAVENALAKSRHPTIDKAAEIVSMTDSSINIIKTLGAQVAKSTTLV